MSAPLLPAGTLLERRGSLDRGLGLLECVATAYDGITLTDLTERAGLDKGTTSRLVSRLVELGYLQRRPDRRVVLTSRVMLLARGFEASFDIRAIARPVLGKLCRQVGETVHLAVPSGLKVVYVDQVEPDREVNLSSIVGHQADQHVTATGRAILFAEPAPMRAAALADLVRHQLEPGTAFDAEELERARRYFAANGYTVVERPDEIIRIAAPVCDATGTPVAAVGVFLPVRRLGRRLEEIGYACRSAARAISKEVTGA